MYRFAAIAVATACLATISLSNNVLASGVYPGSQCQSARSHNFYQLNFSRVQNVSASSALIVDCPVPSHDTGGTIGAGITVRDRHATQNVRCNFSAILDNTAGNFGFVSTGFSSGNSTTPQSINFSSVNVQPHLYYFIGCTLPPVNSGRSEIIDYGSVTFN